MAKYKLFAKQVPYNLHWAYEFTTFVNDYKKGCKVSVYFAKSKNQQNHEHDIFYSLRNICTHTNI